MANEKVRYLFLVDDEPLQNELLKDYITERFLYTVKTFDSGEGVLVQMNLQPEIIILDYHLSGQNKNAKNGVEILKAIKERHPEVPVIMLSGQDKIDVAIDSMKYGAYDYVVKGETGFSRIENALNNLSELHKARTINKAYKTTIIFLLTALALIIAGTITFYLTFDPGK